MLSAIIIKQSYFITTYSWLMHEKNIQQTGTKQEATCMGIRLENVLNVKPNINIF